MDSKDTVLAALDAVRRLSKLAADKNDLIPGGKAKGMDAADIAKEKDVPKSEVDAAIRKGQKVESEHTPDTGKQREIAKDHTAELGTEYYPGLAELEENLKGRLTGKLGEPEQADKDAILRYLMTSANLDDKAMHDLYRKHGVDPHEGEEFLYAALQKLLGRPGAVEEVRNVEEKEPEDEPEKESCVGKKYPWMTGADWDKVRKFKKTKKE